MTINHLNLIVTDITGAIDFFETYFEFTCKLIKGEHVIAILKNKEEFTLVLMAGDNGATVYPKDFHIGFMLGSVEAVDNLHKKLVSGKIEIARPPRKIRDSYGFYFYFDNLFIEVGHYLS